MRCKNCGWPNQPGETNCVKCHAPLEAEAVADDATVRMSPGTDAPNLRKTVLEPSPVIDQVKPVNGSGNSCVHCGFPLHEGSTKCPKCGKPVQSSGEMPRRGTVIKNVANNSGDSKAKKEPDNNHIFFNNNSKPGMKTINPYIEGFAPIPSCSLKPFKRSNENKKIEDIKLDGEEIILKRDNTDADNVTISTECQAVLTNENGKWYIIDKSDARTTFVRAGEKIEIKDGDIVLLGNRLFEFHA